jgi:hypothetical protein
MRLRVALALGVLTAASISGPGLAEQLTVVSARQFVLGKLFAFTCFEGTRGAGRIYSDGSVAGNIQFRGNGAVRYVMLPSGTVRTQGESVCASVQGVPFQPCFNLDKTDPQSFRGSIAGLGFAYCDFTRHNTQPNVLRSTVAGRTPLAIHAAAMAAGTGDGD